MYIYLLDGAIQRFNNHGLASKPQPDRALILPPTLSISPPFYRYLNIHEKEISETRIWAHTWKSNLRTDGQMCQSLFLAFWFIVSLRKRLTEFRFPIPGYSRCRFHYSVTWWLRCRFDKVQDRRFRHTRVTSLVEQHWHVFLWKKEICGSKWT